jgi:pimeloyl-ACP methyl ester carboxylesterase
VFAHGFYNNKDVYLFRKLILHFSEHFDVIGFVFRGHGKSTGLFRWTAQEEKDLECVVEYAKEHNYKRIGVIGFSLGAAIALIAASRTRDINSVIAVSPPYDFWKINYHFWKSEMWQDLKLNLGRKGLGKKIRPGNPFEKKIRPIDIVDKIAPTPVYFVHGEEDWLIDPRHSALLYDRAKNPKKIYIIPKTGHAERIYDVKPDLFVNTCVEWFKKTLI